MTSEERKVLVKGKRKRNDKSDIINIPALKKSRQEQSKLEKVTWKVKLILEQLEAELSCGTLPRSELERIFPEELWEAVLGRLEFKESTRVSRLSDLFEAQIRKWKTRDLFSQVFPHLQKYLEKKDVLNTREVCRDWMEGVDNKFQGWPDLTDEASKMERLVPGVNCLSDKLYRRYIGRSSTHKRKVAELCELHLQSHEKIVSLNAEVYGREDQFQSGKFPMISRRLQLGSDEPLVPNENDEFWEEARIALTNHGNKVWHLTLNLYFERPRNLDYPRTWELLSNLTSLTPNLRSLELHFGHHGGEVWNRIDWDPVIRAVRAQALPQLPHLTTLKVANAPNIFLNGVLRSYSQIQDLEAILIFAGEQNDPWEQVSLPNLVHYDGCEFFGGEGYGLPPRSMQVPRLETLRFRSSRSFTSILKGISVFGSSLRHLNLTTKIQPPRKVGPSVGTSLFLELPILKTLILDVGKVKLKSIDFLLPLYSLRKLMLILPELPGQLKQKRMGTSMVLRSMSRGRSLKSSQSTELIQFFDYAGKPDLSNIWKIFPHLKWADVLKSSN